MYKIIGADQKEYGPVTSDDIRGWIAEGRVNGQTRVAAEGSSEWKPLSQFPELAAVLAAQIPPPVFASGTTPQPVNVEVWSAEMRARPPELKIGACLSGAMNSLLSNFGLFFMAVLAVSLIDTVCRFNVVSALLYWVFHGVFYGGLSLLFLKRIRGEPASLGDTFSGFSQNLPQLLLAGLVGSLLTMAGFFLCILPGIYLFIAWIYGVPLVADKRLEFWSALELSRRVVTRAWFDVFVLVLIAFLPALLIHLYVDGKIILEIIDGIGKIAGHGPPTPEQVRVIVSQVGEANLSLMWAARVVMMLNLPFGLAALLHGYENLFGTRKA